MILGLKVVELSVLALGKAGKMQIEYEQESQYTT